MNDEPFGPVAVMIPSRSWMTMWRKPIAYPTGLPPMPGPSRPRPRTSSGAAVESGMVSINHVGLALPEVPFEGVKESGYGSESGSEATDSYLNGKFVTQVGL